MAYKRPPMTMKTFIILLFALLPSISAMAQQDAEGYYDITQKQDNGVTLRHLQTPYQRIRKKVIVEPQKLDTDIFVSYYNVLTSETFKNGKKRVLYKIGFSIEDHIDFNVVKNNRLLIKLNNGQTIMLRTANDVTTQYLSDDKYHASPSYVINMQQLNNLIKFGASKFRIETLGRNLDVVPDFDVAEVTKEYKAGLYDRLKNKKDSFLSNF
jgi:hypothetical protein